MYHNWNQNYIEEYKAVIPKITLKTMCAVILKCFCLWVVSCTVLWAAFVQSFVCFTVYVPSGRLRLLSPPDTNFDVPSHSIWFTFMYFWIEIERLFFVSGNFIIVRGIKLLTMWGSHYGSKTWVPKCSRCHWLMIALSDVATCDCNVCCLSHFLLQARSKMGTSSWNPQSDDLWNSAMMN